MIGKAPIPYPCGADVEVQHPKTGLWHRAQVIGRIIDEDIARPVHVQWIVTTYEAGIEMFQARIQDPNRLRAI